MDVVARHFAMVEDVQRRLERITDAFEAHGVPYAIVGGQAVALWVASRDPDAVRTTKDVDLLLNDTDLAAAKAAARSVGMHYFEVMGVGMFLEDEAPNPKRAVHLLWAGQRVREHDLLPSPSIDEADHLAPNRRVVRLRALVRMKLMVNRDHDRAQLRDLINVGLVDRSFLPDLPAPLRDRLDAMLHEEGR